MHNASKAISWRVTKNIANKQHIAK
jgi:hypothetical protein